MSVNDVLANQITGVKLAITKFPTRKQACFCFIEGNTIYPVAYIRNINLAKAKKLWTKVLEGIPYKEER